MLIHRIGSNSSNRCLLFHQLLKLGGETGHVVRRMDGGALHREIRRSVRREMNANREQKKRKAKSKM